MKRIVSKMVVQIKSGKRENGKSFSFNLYRKRSTISNRKQQVDGFVRDFTLAKPSYEYFVCYKSGPLSAVHVWRDKWTVNLVQSTDHAVFSAVY